MGFERSISRRGFLQASAAGAAAMAAVPLVGACSSNSKSKSGKKLTSFTFNIGFLPLGRSAPYYYALDLGLYEATGLDVKLIPSSGTSAAVTSVIGSKTQGSFADFTGLLAGASKDGSASIALYADIYTKANSTIFFYKNGPIKTPKDLEGKTITTSPGSNEQTQFPAFAKAVGIDSKSVKWRNVDSSIKMSLLARKQTVASSSSIWSLAQVQSQLKPGDEISYFMYGDYGVPGATGIILRKDYAKDHPDLAKGFVQASIEGYKRAFADPKAAMAAMAKHVKGLDQTEGLAELALEPKVVNQSGHPVGYSAPDTIKAVYELAGTLLDIHPPGQYTDYFSNEFIPQS